MFEFLSIIALAFVWFFIVLGLLWAPFAMVICGAIARTRGLSVVRYAGAGGIYSILFVLPWFYLVVRMFGAKPQRALVQAGYIFLYLGWLAGPIIGGAVFIDITLTPAEWDPDLAGPMRMVRPYIARALTWINVATLVGSLALLVYKDYWQYLHGKMPVEDADSGDILPRPIYLLPFALVLFWCVLLYISL